MQENKINILSTRLLTDELVEAAQASGITIDALSFIETVTIQSKHVQKKIENAYLQSCTVVFTSMNAVEAVVAGQNGQQLDWNIYCIGNTTRQLVKKYFGEESIAGTANSAAELAELIAEENVTDAVIFFCGVQRRDELPEILRSNEMNVNEIVVYKTIAIPHKLEKNYNGILFFSPSTVESFFRSNKLINKTILFAIGNTTASAIKKYTINRIIVSDEPGKEKLLHKMIEYYKR